MPKRRPNSMRTGTSVILSLGIHGLAAVVLLGTVAGSAASNAIERDAPHHDPTEEQPEVLGIEESEAETVTWIGYEEYEEHLARLSEVEQAAMIAAPSSGGGGGRTGASATEAAPPSPPPIPGERRPSASAPANTVPSPPAVDPEVLIDPRIRIDPTTSPTETPTEADPRTPTEAKTNDASPNETTDEKRAEKDSPRETADEPAETPTENESSENAEEKPAEKPAPKPGPTPSPEPAPSNEPTPTPQPEPGETPSEDPGDGPGQGPNPPTEDSGNDADKDSSPTSLVETPRDNWRNGRPLAARGLELRPKRIRPGREIPALVLAQSSAARNPVVELRFPRWSGKGDGVKPRNARLISSTGDSTFDGYLLDALYGWFAKGEVLTTLAPDETRMVRLQLLMR